MRAKLRKILERHVRELPPGRRLRQELARASIERFADGRPLHVLDAGAGEGLFATALGRRHPDWRVDAVDLSEQALALGRELAAERSVSNVRFERADVTQPLGASIYDAAAALECLLEIEEDEAALVSVARALRPGGLLVAHVPEREWKPVLRSSRPAWKHEVRHGYARDELVSLLEGAGLRVERLTPTTRGTMQLAEELRERVRSRRLALRAAALPVVRAALLLERAGLTWGPARGFYVEARKPLDADEPVPGAAA
jgi:2-polyprenyl-3-methyl-5-hydroxy-6-metoxy-1,4-benzoquinol methylase